MKEYSRWNESFEVGIPAIDAQHKRLVGIINELHEGLSSPGEDRLTTFKAAAKNCVGYVQEHFAAEEAILVAAGYPGYEEHKNLHALFIDRLLASVRKFEGGDNLEPNRFLRFLTQWLLSHIAYEDREWAQAIRKTAG